MNFIRLLICNARDAQAHYLLEQDICESLDYLALETGYQHAELWSQDDGTLVILMTTWASRDAALQFESSSVNNLLTAMVSRHVIGAPVVQIYRVIC